MSNNKKFGLGRGLDALLGDEEINLNFDDAEVDSFVNNTVFKNAVTDEIAVKDIEPCKFQPRTEFNAESLTKLAESIKEKGVLQPLLLRRKGDKYEIVAGERRWRAAKQAGLNSVPAVIKDLSDSETLEIALIENLQRENLSPIEEAEGFSRLLEEYQYTQDQLAEIVKKSRSYIANSVRLLNLSEQVKNMVRLNQLSAGHARALVGFPEADSLAKKIVADDLSVRETEKIIRSVKRPNKFVSIKVTDSDLLQIMADLEKKLKLKVKINASQNGKGSVTLKYNNPEELSAILDILEQR